MTALYILIGVAAALLVAHAIVAGLAALASWAFGRMGEPQERADRRTK